MRLAVVLVSLVLTGCVADPMKHKTIVPSETGDVTWWGPTQAIADARAKWYVDPSWRVDANIPRLGYGK